MVDTQGFLLAASVTSAQKRDRHIFPEVLAQFSSKLPKSLHVWADLAYWGANYGEELKSKYGIDLEIVGTPRLRRWVLKGSPEVKKESRKFKVQKRRWVVERTFAWMGRNRRLSKDYEFLPECSTAYLYIAMLGLMLRRF